MAYSSEWTAILRWLAKIIRWKTTEEKRLQRRRTQDTRRQLQLDHCQNLINEALGFMWGESNNLSAAEARLVEVENILEGDWGDGGGADGSEPPKPSHRRKVSRLRIQSHTLRSALKDLRQNHGPQAYAAAVADLRRVIRAAIAEAGVGRGLYQRSSRASGGIRSPGIFV